jgi:hypothetical protein
MKKLFFLSILSLGFSILNAQESYVMFETMYIDVRSDKIDEFEEAFKAHNRKFHAEGASGVSVHYMVNGPHAGQLGWVMGPLTFSDLDNRPSGEDHTDDWNAVMPYVKRISEVEYWRRDAKMYYWPEGAQFSKFHMRYFDIRDMMWEEIIELLARIVEVYKAREYPNSMTIYWNQFNTGNGREVVAVQGFNKYSEYDREDNWVADFESIHGEGSWSEFLDALTKCTDGMSEELREIVPELGGVAE